MPAPPNAGNKTLRTGTTGRLPEAGQPAGRPATQPTGMKQFFAFVKKEFYHILRDRRTMLIVLGIPIVEIILFGFAISTEVKNVRVTILDPSKDVATQRIVSHFGANRYFTVVGNATTAEDIEKGFQSNSIDLGIVFPERFNETLLHTGKANVQVIADGTDPNTATTATNYATSVITAASQELLAEQTGGGAVSPVIVPTVKLLYNPQMEGSYNFVPGVMGLILILICAMMTAISIVREKERGTMEVLLVSPMKPIWIILAKTVPYFTLSCVNLITILLLSVFVLHVPVAGSLFWLTALSMLFIFVALSLGMLISTLAKTQMAAMLISGMGLMMPVMLLSGMMFPVENMPGILRLLSNFVPAKWYIMAVRKIMIEGVSPLFALQEFIVLGIMAVVLVTISLKLFKYRLE